MKIKSLLLGSAAALVAATGAKAADAIVIAEPEPVEYVRVCDAYGAGFFYIPGTETCMRIGGEIRFQLGATNDRGGGFFIDEEEEVIGIFGDTPNYHDYTQGGWNTNSRARVFVDVRSETEWGTLQGYVRMQFDRGTGAQGASSSSVANHAWLSLGGLRMGWTDSAWYSTVNGGASYSGSHSDSNLRAGYQQRNLIQYNFTGGNGFFATLSLEDDNAALYNYGWGVHDSNNYMPDVVLKAGVGQGWGTLWGIVAYDEDRTGGWGPDIDDWIGGPSLTQVDKSGWAAQLGAQFNVPNAPGSSLRVVGYYADSDNAYNGHGGQWSVIGSYGHQFNPQWFASVAAQYTSDLYIPGTDIKTGDNRWDLELNAVWEPVENFVVRGEAVYSKQDHLDGSWSGFLRFSRFF